MIVGIGTDLIDIPRIEQILAKHTAKQFLRRVLTSAERQLAEQRQGRLAEFVAGRFAAKESVAKALGTGIGGAVGFQDIEVLCDRHNKPICTIDPQAMERAGFDPATLVHLSITHSNQTAAAFVVLEQNHVHS